MTKIKGTLTVKGIQEIRNQLKQYQKDLDVKCETFINRLADVGIEVADARVKASEVEEYHWLQFKKKVNHPRADYVVGYIQPNGYELGIIWGKNNEKHAIVNVPMMLEFGSGVYAQASGYRGTFPNQKYAFRAVWGYYEGDELHLTSGTHSTQPLLSAWEEMYRQVYAIAKEVFKG